MKINSIVRIELHNGAEVETNISEKEVCALHRMVQIGYHEEGFYLDENGMVKIIKCVTSWSEHFCREFVKEAIEVSQR